MNTGHKGRMTIVVEIGNRGSISNQPPEPGLYGTSRNRMPPRFRKAGSVTWLSLTKDGMAAPFGKNMSVKPSPS